MFMSIAASFAWVFLTFLAYPVMQALTLHYFDSTAGERLLIWCISMVAGLVFIWRGT